jgi:signal transduction histidine kinase
MGWLGGGGGSRERGAGSRESAVGWLAGGAGARSLSIVDSVRGVGVAVYAVAAVATMPAHQRIWALPLILVTVAGMTYAMIFRDRAPIHALVGLAVGVAAGDTLYALAPHSIGWVVSFAAVPWALGRLPVRWAIPFDLAVVAALGALAYTRESPRAALGLVIGCVGFSMIGLSSRAARRRAEDALRLLESERATREANARAQLLAERQRLAREVHDILAHTLSAQVVQLENARLMLGRGAPADAVRAQIDQAQRLARDGLAETKRALFSLRGDAKPVPEAVAKLAADAGAAYTVEGATVAVGPEAGVALERTVQEALTNARKHAPGAEVSVALRLATDGYEVEVRDDGARGPAPLGETGGGYGLTGMRERAELLGGRLEAGPDGPGFRVWLWIPA